MHCAAPFVYTYLVQYKKRQAGLDVQPLFGSFMDLLHLIVVYLQ